MTLKVGLASNPIPPLELTVGTAVGHESDGFDSLWYPDHLMGWFPKALWTVENSSLVNLLPSPHIYLDPMIVIALVGQATSRVEIGTGVTDPIRRPPAELARTFLTLSHATGGRAILGIGAGERENTVPYGLDFNKQVSRLEEALQIIRLLWTSDGTVDFDGRFWKLNKATLDLQPFNDVLPKIWIGAHGPRMLEITGKYADGWYPSYPMDASEYAEKLAVVRDAAEKAGRDPSSIEAAYQMYAVVADDHETAHRILSSPLAAALTLVATSSQWEKSGRKHPFGTNFEGLRDYVPEWYSKEELDNAVAQFDIEVIHDTVLHGTADEVISRIEPFIDAGLQHPVFANLAPIAGIEYVPSAQAGLKKVAATLKG
jgi:phthiodiolone/phenolphthiodiolone dimycocerosates ketoreductase